jgi:iron(III) transport system permease protein
LAAIVLVVWPATGMVIFIVGEIGHGRAHVGSALIPAPLLFARTLVWAGGVALIATTLAWPVAWAMRRRGSALGIWFWTPLLLPNYLAYSGWGLLRAPQTWLGDRIETLAGQGTVWLPIAAGRAVAVFGLSIWVWPLAAVVLATGIRRLDQSVLDAIDLDVRSAVRRMLVRLSISRSSLVAAICLAMLVMIGSPVPFHLAQVPTYAIELWLKLAEGPTSADPWLASWPLIVLAGFGGWIVSSRVLDRGDGASMDSNHSGRTRWAGVVFAVMLLSLSVLVPLALFANAVVDWGHARTLWRTSREAVGNSAEVAWFVAIGCAGLTALIHSGLTDRNSRSRALTAWCVRTFIIVGVLPGVLTGAAIARAWAMLPGGRWITDTNTIVVLGHLARFGFIPAILGALLAWMQPEEERALRDLDSPGGIDYWLGAVLPRAWPVMAASGVVTFALSLHEIEATIMLQPPGAGSLAHQLLGDLHFFRKEELSISVVVLGGSGLILAAIVAILTTQWRRGNVGTSQFRREPDEPGQPRHP